MQTTKKNKLLVMEICEGDFAREAQIEFERMQSLFARTNQKLTMVMKVTLFPTSLKKGYPERFKEIDYEIVPATAKKKSERYVVEMNDDNLIIGDGKTINDILQEELRFEDMDMNVTPFQKEAQDA